MAFAQTGPQQRLALDAYIEVIVISKRSAKTTTQNDNAHIAVGATHGPTVNDPFHDVYRSLVAKLYPGRFTAMSPRMASLVGGILGQNWARCFMHGWGNGRLFITSDGCLLACRGNCFIGSAEDWESNLARLFEVAELTDGERKVWDGMYAAKVADGRCSPTGRPSG